MTKIILALLKIINFRFFLKGILIFFQLVWKIQTSKSTHKQNKERHLQQYTGRASQLLQLCSVPPQTCSYSVLHGYNRDLTHRGSFLLLATGSQHHYHREENRLSVAQSISASSLTLVSLSWRILAQQTPQLLENEQIAEPTDTFKWEKSWNVYDLQA